MKKSLLFTTLLLAVSSAATAATLSVYAESAQSDLQTTLPENYDTALEFSQLSDFAVNGDEYAFAEGNYLKIYSLGNVGGPDKEFSYAITRIEYVNDLLVFMDSSGGMYSYDGQTVLDYNGDYRFDVSSEQRIDTGEYFYYLIDGSMSVLNTQTDTVHKFDGAYYQLKQYDGGVYALKNNELYKFSGFESERVLLYYDDYSATSKIFTGETSKLVKAQSDVKFVTVLGGAYITEVDLNDLSGTYFTVGQTVKSSEGMRAYLICNTGNASVISVGEKSYITLTSNTTEVSYTPVKTDKANGYISIDTALYSSPYICGETAIKKLNAGCAVKINGLVSDDVLNTDFYLVEADGSYGYVAKPFVTEYDFAADGTDYNQIKDGFTDNDPTLTIVIVLIIFLLIFVAIGYLVFISSKKSSKKSKIKLDLND